MISDLKESYQAKAEELALEKYDSEFYDLPEATRLAVYNIAEELVNDSMRG